MNNLCILLVAFIVFLVNNSKVDCLANTSRKAFIDSVVLLVGFTPESVKAFERRGKFEDPFINMFIYNKRYTLNSPYFPCNKQ